MASPVVVSRIQNRRGLQAQFDTLYPIGYDGVGGYGSLPGFDSTNYPNVLLPGEIALCTDSRRIFAGNINGEYIEVGSGAALDLSLLPLVLILAPSATFAPTGISFPATPFFTILYDLTDNPSIDWNDVGTNFSRNGELKVTAVADTGPGSATLVDSGSEINLDLPSTISFAAEYSGANIVINYMHDFSGPLTFSTTTLKWLPF